MMNILSGSASAFIGAAVLRHPRVGVLLDHCRIIRFLNALVGHAGGDEQRFFDENHFLGERARPA